ncbi:MAG: M48 family metallopeptidase [Eubacteriaceae bacterium]
MKLFIDESEINYYIKKMRRKDIVLKVENNELMVITPKKTNHNEIERYLDLNKNWIKKSINDIGISILGGHIMYLGNNIPLETKIHESNQKVKLHLEENIFSLHTYTENSFSMEKIIEEWYKAETRKIVLTKLEHFKKEVGVNPKNIYVENLFYRWASCSNYGNMKFNWKCAMLPENVIDYVVVHELCHLIELNHSKKYWQEVEKIMPDYEISKSWLDRHGAKLIS